MVCGPWMSVQDFSLMFSLDQSDGLCNISIPDETWLAWFPLVLSEVNLWQVLLSLRQMQLFLCNVMLYIRHYALFRQVFSSLQYFFNVLNPCGLCVCVCGCMTHWLTTVTVITTTVPPQCCCCSLLLCAVRGAGCNSRDCGSDFSC